MADDNRETNDGGGPTDVKVAVFKAISDRQLVEMSLFDDRDSFVEAVRQKLRAGSRRFTVAEIDIGGMRIERLMDQTALTAASLRADDDDARDRCDRELRTADAIVIPVRPGGPETIVARRSVVSERTTSSPRYVVVAPLEAGIDGPAPDGEDTDEARLPESTPPTIEAPAVSRLARLRALLGLAVLAGAVAAGVVKGADAVLANLAAASAPVQIGAAGSAGLAIGIAVAVGVQRFYRRYRWMCGAGTTIEYLVRETARQDTELARLGELANETSWQTGEIADHNAEQRDRIEQLELTVAPLEATIALLEAEILALRKDQDAPR